MGKGIGSHHSANPQTDEWWTPPHILEAVGPFDLDPCAPYQQPDWTGAAVTFTEHDNGLHHPWEGFAWVNPPYSEVEEWVARLARHGDGVALVFARCETRWWFESVWPVATYLLFLRGRLTFYRPPDSLSGQATASKAEHNSGGPSVLIGYGDRAADRLAGCGLDGAHVDLRVGMPVRPASPVAARSLFEASR